MRAVDLIRQKRLDHELSDREIRFMIAGLADGSIPEYQWSAMLMAILWRGMSDKETATLTDAMMRSGIVVDLSHIPGLKVDKHSTGGVGDKTSLILAPIAAACGVPVPMVSGRGLGHTGGTLDKLEAIPGFNVNLDLDRYKAVLEECGVVLIGQTKEIAPADKTLYALRDATATVESIPLISASIMSKKLAEGIDGLVLDVKTGNGAFMETYEDSRALAETMVAIGRGLGKKMRALITRMDQPLGDMVGNALEVAECIGCLRGEGPADLIELSVELAAEMIVMAGKASDLNSARLLCLKVIENGAALEVFRKVIAAQGGDSRVVDDLAILPAARRQLPVLAERGGFVDRLLARPVGVASMLLGAGRERTDSIIDPAVGVVLHKRMGDALSPGEPLFTLLVNDEKNVEAAKSMILDAYRFADAPPPEYPLIIERF